MRVLSSLSCAACLCAAAFAQSAETPPAFEMADIHVSAPSRMAFRRGPMARGTRYELLNATMVDLVSIAYGMDADKVLGGPNWLEWDRFDVIAKMPANSTFESRNIMLRTLLADRFQLKFHKDTQPMPAYALTVGKHPQLKQSAGTGSPGCKWSNQPAPNANGGFMIPSNIEYTCENITMAAFADGVRGMIFAGNSLNGNPVVDRTELKGNWDFMLKYSLQMMGGRGGDSDTITFAAAIEKLGLKLDLVKVPLPVLVVDSVTHAPTDNLPGVSESLQRSATPKEFEVAVIKPAAPDAPGRGMRVQPGGSVNISGMPLKNIVLQAFNVTNDTLVGAPKWLDTDRYDIVAKASTTGVTGPEQQIDIDDVWIMMRALLADRFKLVTHSEERPLPAYTLLAVKPKMKKADPASRTVYREGPSPGEKDPRDRNPALSRLVTCQNMTMAQFAEKLQNIAGGYIHSAVLDSTGLEGGWDFTLSFSPAGMLTNGGGGRGGRGGDAGPPLPADAASDPTGAISLFDAVEKELGLKLELQKRPATVLVIDHMEQKPTDN